MIETCQKEMSPYFVDAKYGLIPFNWIPIV